MALFFLTEIDGIWHVRERGQQVWRQVAPNCRSVREASLIVKRDNPRAMVAVVPRFSFDSGNLAG